RSQYVCDALAGQRRRQRDEHDPAANRAAQAGYRTGGIAHCIHGRVHRWGWYHQLQADVLRTKRVAAPPVGWTVGDPGVATQTRAGGSGCSRNVADASTPRVPYDPHRSPASGAPAVASRPSARTYCAASTNSRGSPARKRNGPASLAASAPPTVAPADGGSS